MNISYSSDLGLGWYCRDGDYHPVTFATCLQYMTLLHPQVMAA